MAAEKPTNHTDVQSEQVGPVVAEAQPYATPHHDPRKGMAKWLTFEYILAIGSLVGSVLILTNILTTLFGGWSGSANALATHIGGYVAGLLSLGTVTPATGLVAASVMAVLLAVVALVLFGRVSKAIAERKDYTKRAAYRCVTYGACGVLVVAGLTLVAKLVGILVSSLLMIGISGAGEVYKSLYLAEFLPYLLGLSLIAAVVYFVGRIIQGRNVSRIVSWIVLGVASAALVASAITVAVQVRDSGSPEYRPVEPRPSTQGLEDYDYDFDFDGGFGL